MPKDLAPHIAKILWMYQMGLCCSGSTTGRPARGDRTRCWIRASRSWSRLLKLSNLPLLKPARRSVLNIIGILESLSIVGLAERRCLVPNSLIANPRILESGSDSAIQ